jgi:hypothetical protein
MSIEKLYLGDSVYAEFKNDMIKLTTWNGYDDDPRNVIWLEPEVAFALKAYIEAVIADETREEQRIRGADQGENK